MPRTVLIGRGFEFTSSQGGIGTGGKLGGGGKGAGGKKGGGQTGKPPATGGHVYWRVYFLDVVRFIGVSELEFRATAGGANQATGGTASAFNNDGNVAANAFDGNTGTFWRSSTANTANWLQYQFPSAVVVTEISMRNETQVHGTRDFIVQSSDNGTTWNDEFYGYTQWVGGDGSTEVFTKPTVASNPHVYWRCWNSDGTQAAYEEIEMRGTPGGADLTDTIGGTPFAEDQRNAGFQAPQAFDNNTATEWLTNSNPIPNPWIWFQFNSAQVVQEVRFTIYDPTATPKSGAIQFSDDGKCFANAWTYSGMTPGAAGTFITTSPAIVQMKTGLSGTASSITLNQAPKQGNILVFFYVGNNSAPGTGWSQAVANSQTQFEFCFTKVCGAGESATQAPSTNGNGDWVCLEIAGYSTVGAGAIGLSGGNVSPVSVTLNASTTGGIFVGAAVNEGNYLPSSVTASTSPVLDANIVDASGNAIQTWHIPSPPSGNMTVSATTSPAHWSEVLGVFLHN